jgi:ADP-ribose pyrophosphatase YjhB (NUDIX family)
MKQIRNSIKAVIVQDGALLLIKKMSETGSYFIFPGGGQKKYENMHTTLKRECHEEIGVDILIGDLLWIREYIGRNHEFAATDGKRHQIEFYFSCRLVDGSVPTSGSKMDEGQVGLEWVPLSDLSKVNVYPLDLRNEFVAPSRVYLGDRN